MTQVNTICPEPTILAQMGINPLYSAKKPSSLTVFIKQSIDDLYHTPLKENKQIYDIGKNSKSHQGKHYHCVT